MSRNVRSPSGPPRHQCGRPPASQILGSSLEGIDDDTLDTFRERSLPQPGGVAASPIELSNDGRLDVPATVICTSLPSPALQQMIEHGQMPSELPAIRDVTYVDLTYVDLPTGHWPMFSRPGDLAQIIVHEALR